MTSSTAPTFGPWPSPVDPAVLALDSRLGAVHWDGDGRSLGWIEGRGPTQVLRVQGPGADAPRDLTRGRDVRAVLGYGGGDFCLAGGRALFVDHPSGRLFRQPLAGGPALALTPGFGKAAAPTVSPDGRWVAYVHQDEAGVDRLAVVDIAGDAWPARLAEGHDFYMQPRWSPDGRQLAWVAWDHPNMPWDGTWLYVAPVLPGPGLPRLGPARVLAGGPAVAVSQPEWTPDGGALLVLSDEGGWNHLWRLDLASGERRPLTVGEAEHGAPAWLQGTRGFALAAAGDRAWVVRGERGFQRLVRVGLDDGRVEDLPSLAEYGQVTDLEAAPVGDALALVASGPTLPPRLLLLDGASGALRVLARASGETLLPADLSRPEPLSWASAGGETAHGLFYPPAGPAAADPGRPPLVVSVHGGPSSQARAGWDAGAQILASRGWAVLALNHRGSTGYGRAYMERLRGGWGLLDVEDAVSGARALAEAGRVAPDRAVIMGGSAGGLTVLQAMVTHPEAFAAGICAYGVANQLHLAAHTHKFEAHYSDRLLGPLPEAAAVYRERSPELRAAEIRRPLALFHGAEDRVVPPEQSARIAAALRQSGTPHLYHVYEGEGHGWRRPETVAHYWRSVEAFLREQVLFA